MEVVVPTSPMSIALVVPEVRVKVQPVMFPIVVVLANTADVVAEVSVNEQSVNVFPPVTLTLPEELIIQSVRFPVTFGVVTEVNRSPEEFDAMFAVVTVFKVLSVNVDVPVLNVVISLKLARVIVLVEPKVMVVILFIEPAVMLNDVILLMLTVQVTVPVV